MGLNAPWAEDPSLDVPGKAKNKFINRASAWMYHIAVSDTQGALSWLLPSASIDSDAAIDELCNRVVPDEQDNEDSLLIGPVLLATFAHAVMISPWHSFKGMRDSKPPHESWYRNLLEYYGAWDIKVVNDKIAKALKLFYTQFPEARMSASRRKSGCIIHETSSRRLSASKDASSMPPDCD